MISLLVVNYFSSALAAEAIRTARETATGALQVVVVDNSCDSREAEALRGYADVLIVSTVNRGYAGAINDGRRACESEVIVVSNPDVEFAPGCIDLLAEALGEDAAVAGPALFWDAGFQWRLPPGDLMTGPQKVDQIFASRSRGWRERRDRRRFRERVAFWSRDLPARVRMLSGAVMAVRARALDDAGGFDERFPLYFEETDFLRRMSELRRQIVYVPAARCRHLYNQSAAQTGTAAAKYVLSERRYLEKWNGPWLAGMLKQLERPMPDGPAAAAVSVGGDVVTEVSPLASFETAAGFFGLARDVPPEVRASIGGELYLRVVERETGRVLSSGPIARTGS